jgi:hypothetical protein
MSLIDVSEYILYHLIAQRESESSTHDKYLDQFEYAQYRLYMHFNKFSVKYVLREINAQK